MSVQMSEVLGQAFAAHRDRLWGLCYRMTGSRTEAEDLVQETFGRALANPPADTTHGLRPWLTAVATRLCIDALRRRQTRGYAGPWLAEPIVTDADAVARLHADVASSDAEVRYGALESATMAFLWTLEALTPLQRAVLLLRDVLGLSGPEVADVLGRAETAVRSCLHRARQVMAGYEERRVLPGPALSTATEAMLARFMAALAQRDAAAMTACLVDDVCCVNDGGGVHHAALKPVQGVDRVVRFYLGISAKGATPLKVEPRSINGLPAWLVHMQPHRPRDAPLVLARGDLNREGKIWLLHTLLAPDKLAAMAPL